MNDRLSIGFVHRKGTHDHLQAAGMVDKVAYRLDTIHRQDIFQAGKILLVLVPMGGRMTFNNVASYWVHMLTHHPDIVRYVRDLLHAIRTSRAFNEQGHRQEVRYS